MNSRAIILMGHSGCGKGTQAKLLIDYFKKIDPTRDTLYLQTGNEFREFIKGSSVTAKLSKNIYDRGQLQPEFLAVYMWVNLLVKKYKENDHMIFDGAPRKFHETGVLHSALKFFNIKKPVVFYIDISTDESVRRLLARGRVDDNEEEIRERLSWFETDVLPALQLYKESADYDFHSIPGEDSVENIHLAIIDKLKSSM